MNFTKKIIFMIMILLLAGCTSVKSPSGAVVHDNFQASGTGFRVAVTAEGDTPNSRVSSGIGKTAYFLIFEDGEFIEAIENDVGSNLCDERIGIMIEKEVDAVICAKFGDNIASLLNQEGIEMVKADKKDKVIDALNNLNS